MLARRWRAPRRPRPARASTTARVDGRGCPGPPRPGPCRRSGPRSGRPPPAGGCRGRRRRPPRPGSPYRNSRSSRSCSWARRTMSGSLGAALDDGQGLQHAVVQGAGHLLAGLGQRDAPLGLAQAGGHEPGHEPGEGVEHDARHDADRVAVGPPGRARQLADAAGQADRRPRQHAAAGPEGDARRHHAGERPGRRQALRVGHAVVGQLVADLEGARPRPPRPPRPGRTAAGPGSAPSSAVSTTVTSSAAATSARASAGRASGRASSDRLTTSSTAIHAHASHRNTAMPVSRLRTSASSRSWRHRERPPSGQATFTVPSLSGIQGNRLGQQRVERPRCRP